MQTGPLLRASLLKLNDSDHVFILNTHHIISDRWSLGALSEEMTALYEQEANHTPAKLAALPVQYGDYAVWQRQLLDGENKNDAGVLEKQLSYWKKNLSGAPASLDLPTDRPRPAQQSFRGAKYSQVLPKSLAEQMTALGRKEGATLFMTLLAAFNVLLARYSNQDDVVVGSPIAGRVRAGTGETDWPVCKYFGFAGQDFARRELPRVAGAGAGNGDGGLCPSGRAV